MFTLTWTTEKELEQETNFLGRKTWQSGGEKMRNASDQLGENERQ